MSSKSNIIAQNYELQNRLLKLGQRALNKGEIFILSKVLADAIPLPTEPTDNIRIHNLKHRNFVCDVLFAFEGYAQLDNDSHQTVYRLIDEMVSWRYAVASGTATSLFSGLTENFVDDVTGFLRYVNMTDIGHGSDIAANANYTYTLFKDVVAILK